VRALIQRVTRAAVRIDGKTVGAIGPGLCVLVGVTHSDDALVAARLAEKVWHLRIFGDESGLMNRALSDQRPAQVLVVSQFTLYGDTRRGRRPSWTDAARGPEAEPLVGVFATTLEGLGALVQTGVFGARMKVELVNDGPVTLTVELP
jgi:D-tyrosyl-tRNA(Tyr) deacylase